MDFDEPVWTPERTLQYWSNWAATHRARLPQEQVSLDILQNALRENTWLKHYYDLKEPSIVAFVAEHQICATV